MASDLEENYSGATLKLQRNPQYTSSDTEQAASMLSFGGTFRAIAIFGIAYALAFKYAVTFSESAAAPLWFPDSVLLCAFLISPRKLWGWYLLVGAPIRLINSTVPLWFLGATFLNDGLKSVFCAYLLQRIIRGPVRLNTLKQFWIYTAISVVGIPALSAMAGALTRLAMGDTFWRAFYQWFLGDATASIALTPTLLYWWFDGMREVKARAVMFFPVMLALAAALYLTFLLPQAEHSPIILYAPLPLLIFAATAFRPVAVSTAISLLSLVSILSASQGRGAFFMVQSQHSVLAMQLFLIVTSVPLLFVAILIEERKAVEAQLIESQEGLRENYKRNQDLAGKLLHAQEEERRRIARELHDDIGQRLSLLSISLAELRSGLPAGMEKESSSANALLVDVQNIAADLQEISRQLHSSTLQHLGLEIALKNLCHAAGSQHHIIIEFHSDDVSELPTEAKLCLFRVAQEALNNALRHGKAKRIQLRLKKEEDNVIMTLSDDGSGFDPTVASEGMGLLSMQERVRFLGGVVLVNSQIGAGTEIQAELPLRK